MDWQRADEWLKALWYKVTQWLSCFMYFQCQDNEPTVNVYSIIWEFELLDWSLGQELAVQRVHVEY